MEDEWLGGGNPIENLRKKPAKGILKPPTITESDNNNRTAHLQRQDSHDKDIKWDERNILATLHPLDKDYGHMKIEEPKTPYSYFIEDDDGVHSDTEMNTDISPDNLAQLIDHKAGHSSRFIPTESSGGIDDDDDLSEHENETEEEKQKRLEFKQKRKQHYNEYQMVKLARELLKEEEDED